MELEITQNTFHFQVPPTSVFLFIGIFLPVPLHPHILIVPFKKCVMKEKSYQGCILFFQLYWSVIDKYNCKIFKVYTLWFGMYTLWKDSLIELAYPSPGILTLFCVWRTFKYYSLSKFQFYDSVVNCSHGCDTLDPQSYSFYNWKFVPLYQPLPNSPTP